MAIKARIETKYGFDAEYWKISTQNINWHNKLSSTTLVGYYNEQARVVGAVPVLEINYSWAGTEFPFTEEAMKEKNPLQIAYEMIKRSIPYVSDGNDAESSLVEGDETNPFAMGEDV